jgi:hypothetical protein
LSLKELHHVFRSRTGVGIETRQPAAPPHLDLDMLAGPTENLGFVPPWGDYRGVMFYGSYGSGVMDATFSGLK